VNALLPIKGLVSPEMSTDPAELVPRLKMLVAGMQGLMSTQEELFKAVANMEAKAVADVEPSRVIEGSEVRQPPREPGASR
jgi:hypothetical protein